MACSGVRVRESGPYAHSEKISLIMAIQENGFRHMRISLNPGTTAANFNDFVEDVIARLPPGRTFFGTIY